MNKVSIYLSFSVPQPVFRKPIHICQLRMEKDFQFIFNLFHSFKMFLPTAWPGKPMLSFNSGHLKGWKDGLLSCWLNRLELSVLVDFWWALNPQKKNLRRTPNQKRLKVSLKRFQRISPLDNNTLYVFTMMPNTKQTWPLPVQTSDSQCSPVTRLSGCNAFKSGVMYYLKKNLASVPSLDTFVPSTVQKTILPHATDVGEKQGSLFRSLSLQTLSL